MKYCTCGREIQENPAANCNQSITLSCNNSESSPNEFCSKECADITMEDIVRYQARVFFYFGADQSNEEE